MFFKQLDTWGTDGEVLQLILPSEDEVLKLVSTSEKNYKDRLGIFFKYFIICYSDNLVFFYAKYLGLDKIITFNLIIIRPYWFYLT